MASRERDPIDDHGASGERRSRLRQYQVQLLERMQAAQNSAVATGRELGVLIGARHCLLDLTQVGEIVPNQVIAPVPLTRDWYLGLANIRGSLTGIIDLARFLGEAAAPGAGDSRCITFAPVLGFNCALRVTRVLGLRKLADMTPADAAADDESWCAQRFTDTAGQSWHRLDLAQLVRDPRFLHVGW